MTSEERTKIENDIKSILFEIISDKLISTFSIDANAIVKSDYDNPTASKVIVQFSYNERLNKVYIEYALSENLSSKLGAYFSDVNRFYDEINFYLSENFHYYMGFYCNLISHLSTEKFSEQIESSLICGPYTVGYWNSVFGVNQFIQDKFAVGIDLKEKERTDKNIFYKFYNDISDLNEKYGYNGFMMSIYGSSVSNYDKDFFTFYQNHKNDKDAIAAKIQQMDNMYKNIYNNYQKKFPEIMKDYSDLYFKHFGRHLEDLNGRTNRFYIVIN